MDEIERVPARVNAIREVLGYLGRYRGEVFVIKIDDSLLEEPLFPLLIRDVVLLHRMGIKVIIVGSGAAAHLAGVIASQTMLPVIGIPIDNPPLGGLDALLSIVQMPSGIPVATVAIDGARNAALLAVQILALGDPALLAKMLAFKARLARASRAKNRNLRR